MNKVAILLRSFDPANITDLNEAKQLRKKGYSDIYFIVKNEGIADINCRMTLLKLLISPFRHYHYGSEELISVINKEYGKENVEVIETVNPSDELIRRGDFSLLKQQQCSYIMKYGLYCHTILENMVNPHRYNHSVSVAKLCKEIADAHHLNSYQCWIMGMYHDIAKGMSKEKLAYYINIYKPYEIDYAVPVWHQYVGAYYLAHTLKMRDKKVLKAIRHHCLGDDEDTLSKIIFIADKLDPSRGYDSSKEIQLALTSIDKAYEVVVKQNKEYLEKEGVK